VLENHQDWESFGFEGDVLAGTLKPLPGLFSEEERSKQPSAFSILRALTEHTAVTIACGESGQLPKRMPVPVTGLVLFS